jgi:predicted transcriptional regulator
VGVRYLFLPIDPRWALAILERTKKWELRSRRPSVEPRDIVVMYATSPLRVVVGSFLVGEVISDAPSAVWKVVRDEIASDRASYLETFGDLQVVHAIQVKRAKRMDPYTPRFAVSQGWRFLDGRGNPAHRALIARVDDSR